MLADPPGGTFQDTLKPEGMRMTLVPSFAGAVANAQHCRCEQQHDQGAQEVEQIVSRPYVCTHHLYSGGYQVHQLPTPSPSNQSRGNDKWGGCALEPK